MSRRDNSAVRCATCRMHESLCLCALVPRIETRTRLVLLLHRLEARKTSNTGRLAAQCLPNSEVLLRGVDGRVTMLEADHTPVAGTTPIYLFPSKAAISIEHYVNSPTPVMLIVPDGTWRQASKMRRRLPGMAELPCVSLPPEPSVTHRLRAETREDGLSTLEAIARALGILEGPEVRHALEKMLRVMVERTLWLRGILPSNALSDGLPEAAAREDPRGGPVAQRRHMRRCTP